MNKPFAALFDMDGVLVDNHEFHFKAWTIFCEKPKQLYKLLDQ